MTPFRGPVRRPAAALAAGALLVAACGGGAPQGSPGPSATTGPSATASLVGATTVDGEPFAAAMLAGRPTVAWFWAPWCTICRAEAPDVAEVAERYADRVGFVGIAGRGDVADMREFVEDTATGGIVHIDDRTGEIWAEYEVYAQPAFVFIATDGRVEVFTGSLRADDLVERVEDLLAA